MGRMVCRVFLESGVCERLGNLGRFGKGRGFRHRGLVAVTVACGP